MIFTEYKLVTSLDLIDVDVNGLGSATALVITSELNIIINTDSIHTQNNIKSLSFITHRAHSQYS